MPENGLERGAAKSLWTTLASASRLASAPRSRSASHLDPQRLRSELASVLVLVPVGILVLVVLAAIAVDSAAIFLGQRQLENAAAAAATDAAGALSYPGFYRQGHIALDPLAARRVALSSVTAQSLGAMALDGPIDVEVVGRQVCVSLTARVNRIFGQSLPGVAAATTVRARATATAAGDGSPSSGPVLIPS